MPTQKITADKQLNEILTQLALLNERLSTLTASIDKSVTDHEERIRVLESTQSKFHGEVNTRLEGINQKIGIFNLAQASFTSIMAFLAYWLKK